MKKILLLLTIIFVLVLSGCSEGINLDNVDSLENNYKYSKVSMGKLKECEETPIIKDAKEFANKFFAVTFNRSYKDNRTIEQDTIMYSQDYLSSDNTTINEELKSITSFYENYEITTELVNVDFKKVVDVNGDAYLNCVLKIRLVDCNNMSVAKLMGFNSLNDYCFTIYNIKLDYVDRGYLVYAINVDKKEGYMPRLSDLEKLALESLSEEERLSHFAYLVSKAQNDRVYYKLTGDEEFKYLSKQCLEALNKNGDYAENTRKLYSNYKLSTELEKCEVLNIIKTDNGYTLKVRLEIKMLECISKEVAANIGFVNGVGSTRTINYEYDIVTEDNEYKLQNSRLIN